jgi:diketogulonate reductase-like aldo/keto reductase
MEADPNKITRRWLIQAGISWSLLNLFALRAFANANQANNLNDKTLNSDPHSQPGLIQRTIPCSGEKITVIGLGTWITFDVGMSGQARERLRSVLKNLVEKKGMIIDSSPMYGTSQQVVGDLCNELKIRDKLFFATKVWTTGKQDGIEQMDDSFAKMKTKTMDLMQVHNLVDADSHIKTFQQWKAEGKIRYWGITHYLGSAIPSIIKIIKKDKPDFVQFSYSIRNREADKELLPLCQDLGIAVIINRPFDGGTLFNAIRTKVLPPWAADYGMKTWAQYFLKFIVSHPAVTATIPGTSNPDHMADNISAAFGILPDNATRNKMATLLDNF